MLKTLSITFTLITFALPAYACFAGKPAERITLLDQYPNHIQSQEVAAYIEVIEKAPSPYQDELDQINSPIEFLKNEKLSRISGEFFQVRVLKTGQNIEENSIILLYVPTHGCSRDEYPVKLGGKHFVVGKMHDDGFLEAERFKSTLEPSYE